MCVRDLQSRNLIIERHGSEIRKKVRKAEAEDEKRDFKMSRHEKGRQTECVLCASIRKTKNANYMTLFPLKDQHTLAAPNNPPHQKGAVFADFI